MIDYSTCTNSDPVSMLQFGNWKRYDMKNTLTWCEKQDTKTQSNHGGFFNKTILPKFLLIEEKCLSWKKSNHKAELRVVTYILTHKGSKCMTAGPSRLIYKTCQTDIWMGGFSPSGSAAVQS